VEKLQTVDYANDKQEETGTVSEEIINHVKISGSPMEVCIHVKAWYSFVSML
jgi:hypothetical protein